MSPRHTVEKIGGASMAATDAVFENVLVGRRKGVDLYNRVFVVSAYAGITDLLLEHKKSGAPGIYARFVTEDASWEAALDAVRREMRARNAAMFARAARRDEADAFVSDRLEVMRDCLADLQRLRARGHFQLSEPLAVVREMLAGLGEAHSAHSTALLLQDRGIDAAFIDLTGWGESAPPPPLDERIRKALADVDPATRMPIVTGYARCEGGMVSVWDRGYSEITFSRIAALTGAREAIIHKEFHLSSADPKLVGAKARKIGRTNYDVADQLANLGMEAIHPRAARELRLAGIPLRVRSSFDREDEGTLICGDHVPQKPRVEIVTGLPSLFALQFFEQDMVGEKGFDAAILEALTRQRARIVSKTSNANTITHYLAASAEVVDSVVADLQARFPAADISAREVAIVSAIGSDIGEPRLVAEALAALARRDVPVIGLQHQIRNVDVQFIVEPADFERATVCLHDALVAARSLAASLAAA